MTNKKISFQFPLCITTKQHKSQPAESFIPSVYAVISSFSLVAAQHQHPDQNRRWQRGSGWVLVIAGILAYSHTSSTTCVGAGFMHGNLHTFCIVSHVAKTAHVRHERTLRTVSELAC